MAPIRRHGIYQTREGDTRGGNREGRANKTGGVVTDFFSCQNQCQSIHHIWVCGDTIHPRASASVSDTAPAPARVHDTLQVDCPSFLLPRRSTCRLLHLRVFDHPSLRSSHSLHRFISYTVLPPRRRHIALATNRNRVPAAFNSDIRSTTHLTHQPPAELARTGNDDRIAHPTLHSMISRPPVPTPSLASASICLAIRSASQIRPDSRCC
jgi:hypothetical protein